jgi:hypothetical protein
VELDRGQWTVNIGQQTVVSLVKLQILNFEKFGYKFANFNLEKKHQIL